MREHGQARALLEEDMGPDVWLGARSGLTHTPSSSDAYNKKQHDHMRVLMWRLGLNHVPGGEPAGIVAAQALAELGIGTINPLMILVILQNTPVAHYFVLQHQSNWLMRGSKRMQMIALWAFVYGAYHHLHYDEPILRGSKEWKLPSGDKKSAFEFEGRRFFWNLFACVPGLHGQPSKNKYLDEDGAIFMAAISLVGKVIYPLAPAPPDFDVCFFCAKRLLRGPCLRRKIRVYCMDATVTGRRLPASWMQRYAGTFARCQATSLSAYRIRLLSA